MTSKKVQNVSSDFKIKDNFPKSILSSTLGMYLNERCSYPWKMVCCRFKNDLRSQSFLLPIGG